MGSRRRITLALIGLVVLVVVGWLVGTSGMATKPLSALPPEARTTWQLIQKGGPFKSSQDGKVFENREKLLPGQPASYYHEYTVATPGADDRGARRLIYGQQRELYYTDDHYASFVKVDPGK
ncbi:ribonuclease domain-containing protein [Actinocrispum wychmicini]|uniref:Ribonuclease n=1 Tax=Actinocrispum wychmicini TaxID=1213861 RepID=A0A4R2J382_9PSEU|nr:ribonuclease domain-containing protein [Actinocrispum wychmicini]TCO50819.1 ribonuclease [Actinocrispum wychmicini]